MAPLPSLSVARAESWRRRWDRQQEVYVPDREQRFREMLLWLRAVAGPRPRCLDLGCGTGAVTERILREFPKARVVAVDYDPVTRRLGEVGLARFAARVRWVDADLRSEVWRTAVPRGPYDAALSSTALHWLRGPELARLYVGLARSLRPGGIFLDADGIAFDRGSHHVARAERKVRALGGRSPPPTPGGPAETWRAWWAAAGREPALAAEFELHRARFPHGHEGTSVPDLAGHVRRLRAAGFREVELVYSWRSSRVLAAVR